MSSTCRVFLALPAAVWLAGLVAVTSSAAALQVDAAPAPALLSAEELDELVAPIALYPDSLLAHVLPASTVPLEIVQAARFLEAAGDAVNEAPDAPWDASVKLLLRFPDVLYMMNDDLDWTARLGDAVLAQQEGVMDAIQRVRARARAAGHLESTQQQTVIVEREVIRVVPADPQIIYVPRYDPRVVVIEARNDLWPLVTFGVGIGVGAWIFGDSCDWHGHVIYRSGFYGYRGWYGYRGFRGSTWRYGGRHAWHAHRYARSRHVARHRGPDRVRAGVRSGRRPAGTPARRGGRVVVDRGTRGPAARGATRSGGSRSARGAGRSDRVRSARPSTVRDRSRGARGTPGTRSRTAARTSRSWSGRGFTRSWPSRSNARSSRFGSAFHWPRSGFRTTPSFARSGFRATTGSSWTGRSRSTFRSSRSGSRSSIGGSRAGRSSRAGRPSGSRRGGARGGSRGGSRGGGRRR